MKKILAHYKLQRFFTVNLKNKNADSGGNPELYYENNVVWEDNKYPQYGNELWFIEESDEKGNLSCYVRMLDREITMNNVIQMENARKEWERRRKWEFFKAIGKTAAAVAFNVLTNASLIESFLAGWGIGDTYEKNVGEEVSFDKETFLRDNTFTYQVGSKNKEVILSGTFIPIKIDNELSKMKKGTSRNCLASVIRKNCISLTDKGAFEKVRGYDCLNYFTFEFYSARDARLFLKQTKKCQKAIIKNQKKQAKRAS